MIPAGDEVGLFSARRPDFTDDELRIALFQAVARKDRARVRDLTSQNLERITVLFGAWKTLPPDIRDDRARLHWWMEGLIAVAQTAAALGNSALFEQLRGPNDSVLDEWQNAFLRAQSEGQNGRHAAAIALLENMLQREELRGMVGTAVDELLPKTYGLLGTLYYHVGDRQQARSFTTLAKDHCERLGDREGVAIYTQNLTKMGGPVGA